MDYIQSTYSQKISVEAIAAQLGLDRRYLSQQFKKQTNYTIQGYILNVRITEAKRHLLMGYSIKETRNDYRGKMLSVSYYGTNSEPVIGTSSPSASTAVGSWVMTAILITSRKRTTPMNSGMSRKRQVSEAWDTCANQKR